MNLLINIPETWNPDCPTALAKWMERLPIVRDFETIKQIDERYDKTRASKAL